MPHSALDAFKDELDTLDALLVGISGSQVTEGFLRERIRTLPRTWESVVRPEIEPLFKIAAELEALAALSTRVKPPGDYQKRIERARMLVGSLALYLPASDAVAQRRELRDDLFIRGIPDLPAALVPNALFGWKAQMEAFVGKHPFDKSVFMMIRYRRRNEKVIASVKDTLQKHECYGVLAGEHSITDDLYNPIACLLCCAKGLAVFDKGEPGQKFNPNVAYELGMMHLLGRDCRILKHKSLQVLHSDILMKLYVPYAGEAEVIRHIDGWLERTSQPLEAPWG